MAYPASKVRSFFYNDEPRGKAPAHVTAARIWLTLAGIITPLFGLLYQYADPAAIDPLWNRLLIAALPLVLVGCSFAFAFVREHLVELAYGTVYVFITWFVALTAVNGFSANYAVGLIFVFAALGIAPSVGIRRRRLLRGYLVYATLITIFALLAVPAPGVSQSIFIGCLVGTAFILYIALETRRMIEENLAESEQRYAAVLRQTSDGVVVFDAETQRILDANPAYCALVGYTLDELRGRTLADLTVGADGLEPDRLVKDAAAAANGQSSGRAAAPREHQHRHRDGTRIDVEATTTRASPAAGDVLCMVVRDIRERKRGERVLLEAKEHAENMVQAKSTLLNNVSHELRTPLTGIIGFADVLLEEAEEEQREFAGLIAYNAERLLETLNSVMDLARLEGGGINLRRVRFRLADEVKTEVDLLRTVAAHRDLYLRCVEEAPDVHARLDRACFRRILHNLVGNAIKFTEEGGITVEIDEEEGWAVVRVVDTGVGIGEDFLPELFEEFRQESDGLARSHEGVGLGLAITKRLVHLMDGEIDVESLRGEGSTFTVRFPARTEAGAG